MGPTESLVDRQVKSLAFQELPLIDYGCLLGRQRVPRFNKTEVLLMQSPGHHFHGPMRTCRDPMDYYLNWRLHTCRWLCRSWLCRSWLCRSWSCT